jgi:hypothetical protein
MRSSGTRMEGEWDETGTRLEGAGGGRTRQPRSAATPGGTGGAAPMMAEPEQTERQRRRLLPACCTGTPGPAWHDSIARRMHERCWRLRDLSCLVSCPAAGVAPSSRTGPFCSGFGPGIHSDTLPCPAEVPAVRSRWRPPPPSLRPPTLVHGWAASVRSVLRADPSAAASATGPLQQAGARPEAHAAGAMRQARCGNQGGLAATVTVMVCGTPAWVVAVGAWKYRWKGASAPE